MVAIICPEEEQTRTGQAQVSYCCMLLNPTGQPRKMRANMRLGAVIPLWHQKRDAEDVYTVCRPMIYTRPLLLETTYKEVKDLTEGAFDQCIRELIGPPPNVPEEEATERWQQIYELFQGQIQANKHPSKAKKQTLENILYRYYGMLSKGKYDVGCTDLLEFEVTGDAEPVKAKCRPMPPEIKKDFLTSLDELLQEGVV